jgi:hypothetical protein
MRNNRRPGDYTPNTAYKVIAFARINGSKIRVERWEDGVIRGWNATDAKPATQEEIDAAMKAKA